MTGARHTVLILEDNKDDILLLKEMMAEMGPEKLPGSEFEFVFLTTLADGLQFLETHAAALILLDLSLPDSTGLDTFQTLRQTKSAARIPIIILTVLDDKEASIEAVKKGAQEYLVKNETTAAILFKSIRYAIERHRLKLQLEKETRDLERREDQFIKIISSDPDGVIIVDTHQAVHFMNPAAEILLDRKYGELQGESFRFPIISDESAFTEIEITRTGGNTVTAEMRAVAIEWKGRNAWLISLRDITGRKKLINDLAAEKERLDVTLRSIADGVTVTDSSGTLRLINWMAAEMTGWDQDEAQGKPIEAILKLKNNTTGQEVTELCKNVIKTCQCIEGVDTDDWVLITRDGEPGKNNTREIPVEFSCAPIFKEKKCLGTVWVIRDVTEKREMEQDAIRAQNLEALGTLAGGIAHEYNNILTAALGYLSLARQAAGENKELFNRLKKAEKTASRVKEISTSLLTFSRGGKPRKTKGSIAKTLKDAARRLPKHHHLNIRWTIAPGLWPADFDGEQVCLAFKNILKNAAEAMHNGGSIDVKAENIHSRDIKHINIKRGSYVQVSITDHGEGIPGERQAKIFAPYFSTRKNAEGMGLTTAYSIVRKHDGWLRVTSPAASGKGSQVTILLPASVSPLKLDVSELPARTPEAPPTAGKGKILVMDDEEFVREVARDLLEALRYDTAAAADGEEAVQLYLSAMENGAPFDAVILDLVVPSGMGGKECIKKLTEIDPGVKAIVSSGYSSDPIMAHYRDYGFQGVLPKPYQIGDLQEALEALLRR
jgi:PAS domain S-box-containing protein